MEQSKLQKEQLKSIIECLIFTSEVPLTADKIRNVIEDISKKEIKELIEELIEEYQNQARGIFIFTISI